METEIDNIIFGPEFTFPVPECSLGEFLINKMKSQPKDNIMLVDSDTGVSITTWEILKTGLGVTEGLINIGLKENDAVAFVCKDRSEIDAATLGVISAGGVVAYVGPKPEFEIKRNFEFIKPKYVFSEAEFLESVKKALSFLEMDAVVISFDSKKEEGNFTFDELIMEIDVETYKPRIIDSPSTQLSFITSSSGTTGMPKGVGLSHRNALFQLAMWKFNGKPLHQMKFLQYSRFFDITGILQILLSLATGMQRIFVKNLTDENVLKAIHKFKPTWSIIFPSEITNLMNHPDFKNYDVSSMKLIATGGSAVSEHLINRVKRDWNEKTVVQQIYGMTEMTLMVTESDENNILSVGRLGPGIQIKIVHVDTNKSLGPNKVGEVCIKSNTVMKGYVGNPEATKEIIDDAGWLHTGDLGYYDIDQYLYLVGRMKEIIKFNSWAIPPAELENLILKLPGLLDAGVTGIPKENDSHDPMALVVKQKGSNISEEDVIRIVKENLSDYKHLRGGVKFVNFIPRTRTGKIMRSMLNELALTLYYKN